VTDSYGSVTVDATIRVAGELDRLAARYPAFLITREPASRRGACWVARRRDSLGEGVHTVITDDLSELRAALQAEGAQAG
jgi:hypothetical protein